MADEEFSAFQRAVGRIEAQPADVGGPLPKPGHSLRVIQPRTRCGLMSRSARIRPIWDAEIPTSASASASWVWLQWLAGWVVPRLPWRRSVADRHGRRPAAGLH
jgi:hypothetical protein